MKRWILLFFCMSMSGQTFALDKKPDVLECHKISKSCQVCANGEIKSKDGKATFFSCLKAIKKHSKILSGTSPCIWASKFCYACEDGSFVSAKSKKIIDSDNYECARGPRHIAGGLQ